MSDTAIVGNMAKMMAAQDRLRSMVDRTGASTRRLEDRFGKAAEASARLSQITARPTIAIRDYFSFVIDRLLLQLADLGHTKVDLKLILNDQVIQSAKQLRDLLRGLGGTLSVDVAAKGSGEASASASASASVAMLTITTKPDTNPIDIWIERLKKLGPILKDFGEAFKSFGEGFKAIGEGFKAIGEGAKGIGEGCKIFAEGIKSISESFASFAESVKSIVASIKSLKGLFSGGGKGTKSGAGAKTECCTKGKGKCKGAQQTRPKAGSKTKSKAGSKTKTKTGSAEPARKSKAEKAAKKARARERARGNPPVPAAADAIPEENPAASQGGRLGKLFKKGSKLLKMGGKVLKPLGIGLSAVDILTSDNKAAAAIQAGSGAAGTALGAAIGSFILPGVGTAVGGIVGGWLGDKAGSYLNDKLFGNKDISQDQESKTDLLPAGRESAAADPLQSESSDRSSSSRCSAPSQEYSITVDGITINFPTEKVNEEQLALTIGHHIVSQINAAVENRTENGRMYYV